MKTTITHEIAFERHDGSLGRWRTIQAVTMLDALRIALEGLRDGALARHARKTRSMRAFVVEPDSPRHANGNPIVVHGFTLNLTPTP